MPELRMDDVTKMLDRGMAEMRNFFLAFQKRLDDNPAVPHSILEKFVIPPFPVHWGLGQLGVMSAADRTAHMRYVNWHDVRFRDAKRDRSESPYEPSEPDVEHDDSDNSELRSTRATGSSSKQPVPSHHAFQTITLNPSTSNSQAVAVAGTSRSESKTASTSRKPGTSKSANKKGGNGPNKRMKSKPH
jgi:hypothetical protein